MMRENVLRQIMSVVRRKQIYDYEKAPSKGSMKYLSGIEKEIIEVQEEIERNRNCYLEDELGDILWNFLNMTCALEKEKGISIDNVFLRCFQKYEERMSGLEEGRSWTDIKMLQKSLLESELEKERISIKSDF